MEAPPGPKSDVEPIGVSTINQPNAVMALETNEDSSYDSDFETDETCTSHADVSRTASNTTTHQTVSRCSSTGLSSTHNDVSRTVSDTLGAEFAEYVSTEIAQSQPPIELNLSKSVDEITQSAKPAGYSTRVEFGLKLGYSEKLVQTALQKLGIDPSQNELLGELIKLGAQTSRSTELSPLSMPEDVAATSHHTAQDDSNIHLRPIIIDGSNVAMSHGNKEFFSCRGIKICVDWFIMRGHKEIKVFVPKWRKEASRPDQPIMDQDILEELERDRQLVFTPSRLVGGKRYVCYDDRYILKYAANVDGIVVSNDNYRDLIPESPDFRKVVEERILMYSFVNDLFMPPDDPFGRGGPTLDYFLRHQKKLEPSRCPYGKKCTYGNKCKFHHPERGNMPQKSVADRLLEHCQKQIQARGPPRDFKSHDLKTNSLPLYDSTTSVQKIPLGRTQSAAPAASVLDPHYHAAVVSNFNRAQLDQLQNANKSMDRLPIKIPPKSHSIENINSGLKDLVFPNTPLHGNNANPNMSYGQQANHWNNQGEISPWMYMENQEPNETRNMHRKLQRQLTINPNYDPRLIRLQGINQNPQTNFSQASNSNQWSEHQAVSRIASAPAACSAWPASAAVGPSGSESHLNPNLQSTWHWTPHTSHQDLRNHLHYHLANIFPEDQVQQAMSLYPEETNPQKICAAILSMFHK